MLGLSEGLKAFSHKSSDYLREVVYFFQMHTLQGPFFILLSKPMACANYQLLCCVVSLVLQRNPLIVIGVHSFSCRDQIAFTDILEDSFSFHVFS